MVAPVRARARANELDAGQRWPMIGDGERAGRVVVAGGGVARWVPRVGAQVRRSGSHSHPFGRCVRRGP